MSFFKKWKEKRALKSQQAADSKALNEDKTTLVAKNESANDSLKEEIIVDRQETKEENAKKEEIKKEEDSKKETNELNDEKTKEVKIPKYHVSQNKDENSEHFKSWRVRKEGSQKTIKFFSTQLEAIDYAEKLAENAGSSVVIHKVDGSIRKQDYSKKK